MAFVTLPSSQADPPFSQFGSLLLVPLAGAMAASVFVPLKIRGLTITFGAGIALAVGLASSIRIRPQRPSSVWSPIAAVLATALFLVPVWSMTVAPGADQAMYSAIARGIVDSHPGLSPAWGDLSTMFYPRGFPALIVPLHLLTGPAKASLIAASISVLLFIFATGAFFRAFGLGRYAFPYAVVTTLICKVPQTFFGFGGNSTTLALAWGLLASAHGLHAGHNARGSRVHLIMATVFALAGIATHPVGVLAGLGVGCAAVVLQCPPSRWQVLIPVLCATALLALILHLGGPGISAAEDGWIRRWVRSAEPVFLGGAITPSASIRALWAYLGGPFLTLVSLGTVAALLFRRFRGLGMLVLTACVIFWGIEAVGPHLPVIDALVYPHRMFPALAVVLAIPVWELHRAWSGRGKLLMLALLLAVSVRANLSYFQQLDQFAMATRDDLRAIACLDRAVPREAVIGGIYGDATQWIPALTGRQITWPHVHISLADEFRERYPRFTIQYRFEGALRPQRDPFPISGGDVFCASGDARVVRLPGPMIVPTEWP